MLKTKSAWLSQFVVLSIVALTACGSDEPQGGGNGDDQGSCWPSAPECALPNKAGFECLATYDNASQSKWNFRMSQLQIVKPSVLAKPFLQDTVITHALSMDMPGCYQEGTGRFSWLIQLDSSSKMMKTGGAHVQLNPKDGYCFIDQEVMGFHASPIEIAVTFNDQGDGSSVVSTASPIKDFTVPIFLDDSETDAIMMPLHQVVLENMMVAKDHNCIGAWMGDELEFGNNCKPIKDEGQRMQWKNAATLRGYITVEEADSVWVPAMQQTLCVALSGDAGKYAEAVDDGKWKGKRCKRDANKKLLAAEKADWCSAGNKACAPPDADAFALEGQFAASAVKILDQCP